MQSKITYTFDDDDFDLLNQGIPRDPCRGCGYFYNASCCGCDKERSYLKKMNEFKKRGLDVLVKSIISVNDKYSRIDYHKKEIEKYRFEINEDLKNIPEELRKYLHE